MSDHLSDWLINVLSSIAWLAACIFVIGVVCFLLIPMVVYLCVKSGTLAKHHIRRAIDREEQKEETNGDS